MNSKGMDLIKRRIAALDKMETAELEEKFQELFGFACGQTTAINLRKRIAYKIQELLLGGLSEEDQTILDAMADRDPLANIKYAPPRVVSKTIGTRYRRVWKGVPHEVVVLGDKCYEWQGEHYKSLSAIARKITGTNWSGRAFFGVK